MYDQQLKELENISKAVGYSPDLVQGGGGNTSVKISDSLMAVKASGFQLKQITDREGFVVVNFHSVKKYYESVDLSSSTDFEKESVEFVKNSVVELEGLKKLRPSVEAGFHSVLKKYVIHTHPVYANILCCSRNGKELVGKIFEDMEFDCLWIPYINPGFSLTLKIIEGINEALKRGRKFPEVIFMENHGLIVTSDTREDCIKLHSDVNNAICQYLGIKEAYPQIELIKADEQKFISKTEFLNDFFKNNKIDNDFFNRIALYPDQLVYLNGSISVDGEPNKLNISTGTGELSYSTDYNEAITIEETLLAYIYVVEKVKACGFEIKTMSETQKDFINNWESEKYRKSLVSK